MVNGTYWKKGLFNTFGNIDNVNICFSYAFCDASAKESWIDESGNHVEMKSYAEMDFLDIYAYSMANGIAKTINEELIISGYK